MTQNLFDTEAHDIWARARKLEKKAGEPSFRRGRITLITAALCDSCDDVSVASITLALLGDARKHLAPADLARHRLGEDAQHLHNALLTFPKPTGEDRTDRDARRLLIADGRALADYVVSPATPASLMRRHFMLDEQMRMMDRLQGQNPRLDAVVRMELDSARRKLEPLPASMRRQGGSVMTPLPV